MDPIADFLTRLRNAGIARKSFFDTPSSKLLVNMAHLLKKEGYISGLQVTENQVPALMRVYLRQASGGKPFIKSIKRKSRPGKRLYKKSREIKPVRSGYGLALFSTSQGIMTGKEALQAGLGGEWLCELW